MKLHAEPRTAERAILQVPLEAISPSPYQPRRLFPEGSVAELAESIRMHGLLSPLLVRRIAAGKYELIAGERRLRALKLLGRSHADVLVLTAFDQSCALLALVENLQREELHYLDEAEACRAILDVHGITQEALARSLSVSASALANRLRLLKLSAPVRHALRESGLTERHARALLRLSDENVQLSLIRESVSLRLNVRQLETRIERRLHSSRSAPQHHAGPIVRDNRIVINAVMDTVRELNRIGIRADGRIEEHPDSVDIIVTIRPHPNQTQKEDASV